MKKYESPVVELVTFEGDGITSQTNNSGTCRCYLDIGVKTDYSAEDSGCWTDSEDASGYDVHDAPL